MFFALLTLRQPRAVEVRSWERADDLPACKGSVDSLATRPCPWPELAVANKFVCPSHVYLGKHPSLRGITLRACIPHHRDSGISAGCEIPAARDTPAHAHVKDCVEDSFVARDGHFSANSDFGSGRLAIFGRTDSTRIQGDFSPMCWMHQS